MLLQEQHLSESNTVHIIIKTLTEQLIDKSQTILMTLSILPSAQSSAKTYQSDILTPPSEDQWPIRSLFHTHIQQIAYSNLGLHIEIGPY